MEMMERNMRTNEKGLVKCMFKLMSKLWGLNIECQCVRLQTAFIIFVGPFRKLFAVILSESFEFSQNILGCSASNELLCTMRRGLKI